MNRQIALIVVGTGLACAGIGYVVGASVTREKLQKEYEESAQSFRRAMALVPDITVEAPADSEEELAPPVLAKPEAQSVLVAEGSIQVYDQDAKSYSPNDVNPYHTFQAALETPTDKFLSSEPNVYGIAYIEEEDWNEEDGRSKEVVSIVMNPTGSPTFFLDGEMIDDWADRLGPSIVKDFIEYVPSHTRNPVLYVRNVKTQSDYAVIPEQP